MTRSVAGVVVGVLVALTVSPVTAVAAGTRVQDGRAGELTYQVLLPSDYGHTARRYPVVYLFPPGGNTAEDWFIRSGLLELSADSDVIVVVPNGGQLQLFVDARDGSCRGETQMMDELIPAIDRRFRTIADGRHRAIAGASTSAFSAMHLAARHPDRFAAAGSFDGPPDSTFGMGAAGIPFFFAIVERYGLYSDCGGDVMGPGLWGYPAVDEVWWRDANPADLASNLRGMTLYVAAPNGQPCDAEDVRGLTEDQQKSPPGTAPVFQLSAPYEGTSSRSFVRVLEREGISHTANVDDCGLHSWRYWDRDLHAFWPLMQDAFGTPPADAFDHRRAAASFTAWGWTFDADPDRAPEFLDVRQASRTGLMLTGSGLTTVTTAPYFKRHQPVQVTVGGVAQRLFTGADGRLTFTVDLGPPHQMQQYRAENVLAQASPSYFTTRTVQLHVRG